MVYVTVSGWYVFCVSWGMRIVVFSSVDVCWFCVIRVMSLITLIYVATIGRCLLLDCIAYTFVLRVLYIYVDTFFVCLFAVSSFHGQLYMLNVISISKSFFDVFLYDYRAL